jgi:hypothetical protein
VIIETYILAAPAAYPIYRSLDAVLLCCQTATPCRAFPSRCAALLSQISKQFNLYHGSSFCAMNLKFVDDVAPPPCGRGVPKSHRYNIVSSVIALQRKLGQSGGTLRIHRSVPVPVLVQALTSHPACHR